MESYLSRYESNRIKCVAFQSRVEFIVLERAYHIYKGDESMAEQIEQEITILKSRIEAIFDEQVELFFKINKNA